MFGIRTTSTLMAATAFAFATAVAFVPAASAQVMGEYGATVGNAAASAGRAPAIRPPDPGSDSHTSTHRGGSSGPSQTIEISGGRSGEAAPRTARTHEQDSDAGDATDDWVQVK